jgi:hypothetical protein
VSFYAVFSPLPTHPTKPLVRPSCSLYEKQFRFPVAIFFIRILLFWSSQVLRVQCIGQQFWGWGELGWETGCGWGMTYCRLLKWAGGGDLGSMARRGDFVNCALPDLFFVSFTAVQICSLTLLRRNEIPPRNVAWRDFVLGILLLEPCISLICAWKTNKCNSYSFSLLIMYGSSYMFRHYTARFREHS